MDTVFAYIDAGTGSMILQALLGGAAGIAVFFKSRGRRLFRRNPTKTADRPDS